MNLKKNKKQKNNKGLLQPSQILLQIQYKLKLFTINIIGTILSKINFLDSFFTEKTFSQRFNIFSKVIRKKRKNCTWNDP